MTIREMIYGGGGAVLLLLTIVQITPIKINPWSALAKATENPGRGRLFNLQQKGDILKCRQRTYLL